MSARTSAKCQWMEEARELEHPKLLQAVREDVMPGVAPEQHRLTGLDDLDLASFGVSKDKGSLEHEVSDVRTEDGAMSVRMETAPARRQRVDKHVDQIG